MTHCGQVIISSIYRLYRLAWKPAVAIKNNQSLFQIGSSKSSLNIFQQEICHARVMRHTQCFPTGLKPCSQPWPAGWSLIWNSLAARLVLQIVAQPLQSSSVCLGAIYLEKRIKLLQSGTASLRHFCRTASATKARCIKALAGPASSMSVRPLSQHHPSTG